MTDAAFVDSQLSDRVRHLDVLGKKISLRRTTSPVSDRRRAPARRCHFAVSLVKQDRSGKTVMIFPHRCTSR